MTIGNLSMARRHVLGEYYERCNAITDDVPVYFDDDLTVTIGHVNEALGHYADAFTFHLADDVCKRMSAGHFQYSFDVEPVVTEIQTARSKVQLVSIILTQRKGYEKPMPRKPKMDPTVAVTDAAS